MLNSHKGDEGIPLARLIVGGVAALLICVGLVCAIIGLASVPRHGREGILWRSFFGLLLNVFFVFAFVSGFQGARTQALRNKQAREELEKATKEFRAEQRRNFDPVNGITNSSASMDKYRRQLQASAGVLKGTEAQLARANASFLSIAQAEAKRLEEVSAELEKSGANEPYTAKSRSDLAAYRVLWQRWEEIERAVRKVTVDGEAYYLVELKKAGLAENDYAKALAGFRSGRQRVLPAAVKVRDASSTIGSNSIAMLDLLDTHWGKWRINEKGTVVFDEDPVVEQFNSYIEAIQKASKVQLEGQREMLSVREAGAARSPRSP